MPPVPVPMITPTRRRSRSFQRSSRQESFTACTAAPIANWAKRSYRRASFFSRYSDGSHCFTSWANLTGRSAGSKRVIGPAPDFPATSASHVSATVLPSGVTSPRPVTATRRRTLLPHLLVEILHRGTDGLQLLGLFVRNVDVEFLLEGHHELDRVQAVGAQVLHEAGIVGELVPFDAELLHNDVFDLLLQLLHVHGHG